MIARQDRLALRWAHKGEDETVTLFDRIPGLPNLVPKQTALRLAGLFKTVALRVKQPAVIAAADAARLHLAVIKRGTSMAATRMDQACACRAVTKQDEVFAERPHFA